ncbi:juvenile hormone esterase-like [Culicoides brevitarsis]|uniref:juvenile hormone esterase-like n=1 Tax=Culicoides brevitarsis TaxID=469753 RepID=UPI00307CA1BE
MILLNRLQVKFCKFYFSTTRMSNSCTVTLRQGTIVGSESLLPNGKKFYSFKGVPYAQPPKRFQAPLPITSFGEKVLQCTEERAVAVQRDMFGSEYIGSEDCLFLNIYTPALNGKKLPVMFWIHGGAFNSGSGNSDLYSPEYLVQEDVVVVTINYRLGPLGFLYLPSAGIHGNFGLKDQLQALKFVSQNIETLGGDKDNITLFGESAGGASVNFHFLSKESRKYFHKAICQSGVVMNDWVLQVAPVEKSCKLAKLLGCKDVTDHQKVRETLLNASAEDIARQANHTVSEDEKRRSFIMPFRPVVESQNTVDPFVKEHPLITIQRQDTLSDIPLISGVTDMEGMIMLKDCLMKTKSFNEDFCKYIPMSLNVLPDSKEAVATGKTIKEFYFGSKALDNSTEKEICEFMTDFHFSFLHYMHAELMAKHQRGTKQYIYRFSFDGELNMFKKFYAKTPVKGACHADDIFYLFNMTMAHVPVEENSDEAVIRASMTKLWTNFAKYGEPTPKNTNLGFIWEPVDQVDPLKCLDINKPCKLVTNPDDRRIQFWRGIYKKWNKSSIHPKL